MLIFSLLHKYFSFDKSHIRQGGFSLIELLVSTAIIALISSVVLTKHSTFDSTVLLKNEAYEIGFVLREAQTKSVSVVKGSGTFEYPYGVSFNPGSNLYTAFRYEDAGAYPRYSGINARDIESYIFDRTIIVKELCFTAASEWCTTDTGHRFDISFKRPEFKALYYVFGNAVDVDTISNVKIKIGTPTGSRIFVVEVSKLGQISVYKE